MVTFDKDPCLTEVTKVTALSLSVTFLGHSLQGNIGSPLLMLLMLLEFILVSLKLKKNNKKNINKLITLVYLILLGRWLK